MKVGELVRKLSALDQEADAVAAVNADKDLRRLVACAFNAKVGEMLAGRRALWETEHTPPGDRPARR